MGLLDFLRTPTYIIDRDFCNEYIILSEKYWNLSDKDNFSSIDSSLNDILTALYLGEDIGIFNGMSENQIKKAFEIKKIEKILNIPHYYARKIQEKLNECLMLNKESAQRCNMQIPERDLPLSVREYYDNYLKALEYLKRLELIMMNKKGGFNG